MMQYLHEVMENTPEYIELRDDLLVAQEWGPSNFIADALSRGKPIVAEQIMKAKEGAREQSVGAALAHCS